MSSTPRDQLAQAQCQAPTQTPEFMDFATREIYTYSAFSLETSHVFVTGRRRWRRRSDDRDDSFCRRRRLAHLDVWFSCLAHAATPLANEQPGHVLRVADEEESLHFTNHLGSYGRL